MNATDGAARVLIAADERETADALARLFAAAGHRALTAADAAATLDLFAREGADVVVLADTVADTALGVDLIRRLQALNATVPIIMRCAAAPGARARRWLVRELNLHGVHVDAEGGDRLLELVESALAGARRIEATRATQELRGLIFTKFTHDLRSLLYVIRGYGEILCSDLRASALHPIAERLSAATDAAVTLTKEALELARPEAVWLPVRREPLDLAAVLDEVRRRAAQRLGQHAFSLGISGTPADIHTDADKVRAIFAQLVDSAIRFNASGRLRLNVHHEPQAVEFVLGDGASGTKAPDYAPDGGLNAPRRDAGLAIALHLSAMIGAALSVHGSERQGVTLRLRLPAAGAGRHDAPPAEPTVH